MSAFIEAPLPIVFFYSEEAEEDEDDETGEESAEVVENEETEELGNKYNHTSML